MKKVIGMVLAALLIVLAVGCNNPNKSPTDKVGGYHTSMVRVERTIG